jgi:CheY-like chemotaxis protein
VSILIVEDNTISLRMLEVMLQSQGLETVSAKSGRQALEKLQQKSDIQLILSDLMMPEMDGYQLLEELGKNPLWREIPTVILTALTDAETVRKVASLGCRHYVVKPIKEDMLLPKVRLLLREAGAANAQLLRSKFRVLEETGLGMDQYDKLFDTFHGQLKAISPILAELGEGATPPDSVVNQVLGLRDGASVLASGKFPAMLEGLRNRGQCDWTSLKEALEATLAVMNTAAEKRDRIREKAAKVDAGDAASA